MAKPQPQTTLQAVAHRCGSYAWGCCFLFSPILMSSSSNQPPQSTLQAVAHRHGGGCCAVWCCALCFVVIPVSQGESVTWQGYGWALVCILQVSSFRGLLVPLPDILSLAETLTSWMGRRDSMGACGCRLCHRYH